jgi:ATP-dependent Lon protease
MTNVSPQLRDSTEAETPAPPRPTGASPAGGEAVQLPADALPILPIRNSILFPGVVIPLSVARPRSLAAIQHAVRNKSPLGVLLQRDAEMAEPGPADLHAIGTLGVILRYATAPDGSHHIICGGDRRFRIVEYLAGFPFLVARFEAIEEPEASGPEIEARMMQLKERAAEALKLIPDAPEELAATLQSLTSPAAVAYVVSNVLDIKIEEKQQILEINDVQERLDRVLWFLAHRLEVLRLSHDIGKRTRETMEGRQREFLLREQLKTIQKELGEGDDAGQETASLPRRSPLRCRDVEKHARKELARLSASDQSGDPRWCGPI